MSVPVEQIASAMTLRPCSHVPPVAQTHDLCRRMVSSGGLSIVLHDAAPASCLTACCATATCCTMRCFKTPLAAAPERLYLSVRVPAAISVR